MLPEIHQDVYESMTHGPRGRERARMIPIIPEPPAAAENAVHRAGQTDGKAADSAGERMTILGLGDEVDVIVLN
jgi:hypothetical protein